METIQKSKTKESFLNYKKFEKDAQIAIKISKKDFEKKLASSVKEDPKKFYSYANNKKSVKPKIGPIKEGDNLLTEDKDIASISSKQFFSRQYLLTKISKLYQMYLKHVIMKLMIL